MSDLNKLVTEELEHKGLGNYPIEE